MAKVVSGRPWVCLKAIGPGGLQDEYKLVHGSGTLLLL